MLTSLWRSFADRSPGFAISLKANPVPERKIARPSLRLAYWLLSVGEEIAQVALVGLTYFLLFSQDGRLLFCLFPLLHGSLRQR